MDQIVDDIQLTQNLTCILKYKDYVIQRLDFRVCSYVNYLIGVITIGYNQVCSQSL